MREAEGFGAFLSFSPLARLKSLMPFCPYVVPSGQSEKMLRHWLFWQLPFFPRHSWEYKNLENWKGGVRRTSCHFVFDERITTSLLSFYHERTIENKMLMRSALLPLWCYLIYSPCRAAKISPPEKPEKLAFQANCHIVADDLACENPNALRSFLRRSCIRDLFLSAGGKHSCKQVPIDAHVTKLWKEASEKYYGQESLPASFSGNHGMDSDDQAFAMATEAEIKFPGFKIVNTVLNGCKVCPNANRNDRGSVFEFYLIGDHKKLVGPAPIVWLVRKLMGESRSNSSSSSASIFVPSETSALSRVLIRDQDNVSPYCKNEAVCLDIQFAVRMEFSKMLLKLLPAPKSKIEERGTNAVRKAILKDANAAMEAFKKAWLEEHTPIKR